MIRLPYAIAAIVLLLVETAIALWVEDAFVRPYVGDGLAVLLVHCALRAVAPLGPRTAAGGAFAVACLIEASQYVHLVERIGLGRSPVARAVLGTGFDPRDFLAYAAGGAVALMIEAAVARRG